MPVSEQTPVNSSTGNGVTTVFPYTFLILDQADIEVTVDGVVQTLTTHYSVSGVGVSGGGNVTFVSAPANATTVIRSRNMAIKREIDYQENGDLAAATLDDDLDRTVLMIQQLSAKLLRAIKIQAGETTEQVIAETAVDRALKLLGFDSSGNITTYTAVDVNVTPVSTFAATLLDDLNAAEARETLGAIGTPGGNLTGLLTFAAGADIASAATIDLTAATGNMPRVTGTTGTSAATMNAGQLIVVTAAAAWPLTYHATNMRVITGAGYTCTAEEPVLFYKDGSGVVHVWPSNATVSSGGRVQDFRLTLQSATPAPNTDQVNKTTIYCTPYVGNQISLYTGSAWVTRTSAEFSLSLGTLTSGKPYDVFCYDNSGTPTLEFLAWTSDTARATALAYQGGVYVKSGDATRRYIGTFFTTSTTTTEDSMANRYLYNYHNRVTRPMGVVDATSSWTYTTATYRQMRATSTNALNFMQGVDEDGVSCNVSMSYANTGSGVNAIASIGLDSTSAPISTQLRFAASNSYVANLPLGLVAHWRGFPGVGKHSLYPLEYSMATGTTTWYGSSCSGIFGEVRA